MSDEVLVYSIVDDTHSVCPYCKSESVDWTYDEPIGIDETIEESCETCGKKFYVTCGARVYYTSEPDCELNKESHSWHIEITESGDPKYGTCRRCDKMLVGKDFRKFMAKNNLDKVEG